MLAALVALVVGCGGGAPGVGGSAAAGGRSGAGGSAAARGASGGAATLTAGDCDVPPGFSCRLLRVPLDRADPGGRRLTLRVAVQDGGDDTRGLLVTLSGGPGQPGLDLGGGILRLLGDDALRGLRVVALEQRGTGAGALRCPDLQEAAGTSDLVAPPAAAVRSCAATLASVRDDFATADTVADLEALRQALRAPRLSLLGISYGTFVAERYALAHPATTGRLVLDSVVPQEGADALSLVSLQATSRVLRAACGSQACERDLRALLRRAPDRAVPLFDALTTLTIVDPRLTGMAGALHAGASGDLDRVDRLIAAVHRLGAAPAERFSAGLHAATLCADLHAPWGPPTTPTAERPRAVRRAVAALPSRATGPWPRSVAGEQGLAATCARWPAMATAPPRPTGTINAPALLLAGTRDLSTPQEWAEAQAARMPGAQLRHVPGAGHSILRRTTRRAVLADVRAFLAA